MHEGTSAAELFRSVGFYCAVGGVVFLFLVEFVLRRWIARTTYYWLLLLGFVAFPSGSLVGTASTVLEGTKTVDSCNSCHVMEPFVADLRNPESETLASQHARYGWIHEQQCYQCHTTYGLHGSVEAKRDGFRHWYRYVTGTYALPIEYRGEYPNDNCLKCHGGTPIFLEDGSHEDMVARIESGEWSCLKCHGPVHPPREERLASGGER